MVCWDVEGVFKLHKTLFQTIQIFTRIVEYLSAYYNQYAASS